MPSYSGASLQLGWCLWQWCAAVMVKYLITSHPRFTLSHSSKLLVIDLMSSGVADIMGRRFGSSKLPHNQHKSWAGSISMFVFGFLISLGWVSNSYLSTSLRIYTYIDTDLKIMPCNVHIECYITTQVLDIFHWIGTRRFKELQ